MSLRDFVLMLTSESGYVSRTCVLGSFGSIPKGSPPLPGGMDPATDPAHVISRILVLHPFISSRLLVSQFVDERRRVCGQLKAKDARAAMRKLTIITPIRRPTSAPTDKVTSVMMDRGPTRPEHLHRPSDRPHTRRNTHTKLEQVRIYSYTIPLAGDHAHGKLHSLCWLFHGIQRGGSACFAGASPLNPMITVGREWVN